METRLKALASGARGSITKPFVREDVVLRVRNMLEVRTLYKAQAKQTALLEDLVAERTERRKAIMECAPDLIISTDGHGGIATFNRAATRAFRDCRIGQPGRPASTCR